MDDESEDALFETEEDSRASSSSSKDDSFLSTNINQDEGDGSSGVRRSVQIGGAGIFKAFVGIALIMVIFFSGFMSLGMFIIGSLDENNFSRNALPAQAKILETYGEEYLDSSSDRIVKKYRKVLKVEYRTVDGHYVQAKLADKADSLREAGEFIDVSYNPSHYSEIRYRGGMDEARIFKMVSLIAFVVFCTAILFLIVLGRFFSKK